MSRSLEITTMIGCPLMCTICPQDKLKSVYSGNKYLTLSDYKIILNKLPNDLKIIFSGYSEAWANPNATDILEYTLECGFSVDVYTTLYGMSDVERVVYLLTQYEMQVGQIWLHLPDSSGNMIGFKYNNEYLNTLKKFLKLKPNLMTMSSTNEVHHSLSDLNLTVNEWIFHTRAENVDRLTTSGVELITEFNNEYIVECVRNEHMTDNVLLPNGDVTLCCMDYGNKHILGNLLTQEYKDIIENIYDIKKKNHILFDTSTLCRTCQDTFHKTPWNDNEVYELVKNNSAKLQ